MSNVPRLFQVLLEHGRDPVLVIASNRTVRYASPALERGFGHALARFQGQPFTSLVHPEDVEAVIGSLESIAAGLLRTVSCRFGHADGTWRDVELEFQDLRADSAVEGVLLTVRDVSQRRLADEALAHKALHDGLTGLPNRSLLLDRLNQALGRAQRTWRQVAVLFLDLDNFKIVNDSLGHDAGDLVLTEIARRLLAAVRSGDTVARFGGDEFAILLEDVVSQGEAALAASRLAAALRDPLELEGREVYIAASIGIAMASSGRATADDLLRQADLAMYYAKGTGRGRYAFFERSMQERADERLTLEADLRRAIDRQELRVHYQPIVRLGDGQLTGFEALVRWDRPGVGLMPPLAFVPVAEDTGLIVPLGRWVLEEACRQLRRWQQQAPDLAHLTVSVNLSARQLQSEGLIADVARILNETGVDPACVTLEITESVLVHDAAAMMELLHRLKGLGVQLAIDDFGTGYSSLSYLKRLPVDRLKIDASFVSGLGQDGQDQAIVRGIVELAGSLDLTTTAEGIETDMQLQALLELGGTAGQGYLFARPISPEDVDELLLSRADQPEAPAELLAA